MTPFDLARRLVAKADQDLALFVHVLGAEEVADEVIGFHCQQAAEKLLKSIFAARGLPFRRTHDLAELLDGLADAGLPMAPTLAGLEGLTPFAVDYRYDLMDGGGELDRIAAPKVVRALRDWAGEIVEQAEEDSSDRDRGA